MAEASIPVDLFNPGQVFACIGFAEAVDVLLGDAQGCFDWSRPDVARFHLRARGEVDPIAHTLSFLAQATVTSEAPAASSNIAAWKRSWGDSPRELPKGAAYPAPDPESPATLVAALQSGESTLRIDHWADTVRDNVKFWAGAGGYPGAALARDALDLIRDRVPQSAGDPFALAIPQSSSFRLDWRRDYVPIDAGFSLNAHGGAIQTVGFPVVEILGAIGLTHARPRRLRTKLEYEYGVLGTSRSVSWVPLSLLRAALGVSLMPFEMRNFRIMLSWPGKEGQARSISQVTEGI